MAVAVTGMRCARCLGLQKTHLRSTSSASMPGGTVTRSTAPASATLPASISRSSRDRIIRSSGGESDRSAVRGAAGRHDQGNVSFWFARTTSGCSGPCVRRSPLRETRRQPSRMVALLPLFRGRSATKQCRKSAGSDLRHCMQQPCIDVARTSQICDVMQPPGRVHHRAGGREQEVAGVSSTASSVQQLPRAAPAGPACDPCGTRVPPGPCKCCAPPTTPPCCKPCCTPRTTTRTASTTATRDPTEQHPRCTPSIR